MIDRNRRRDLTVGLRHKDAGLGVFVRQANRRDRYASRRWTRDGLFEDEAHGLDLDATTLPSDGAQTLPRRAL